jgi:peptidoglycan hydrolase-like protein with peptidoglycan-binding domain
VFKEKLSGWFHTNLRATRRVVNWPLTQLPYRAESGLSEPEKVCVAMVDPKLKTAMASFLALTGLVGGNLFFMQSAHRETAENRVLFKGSGTPYLIKPPRFAEARQPEPAADNQDGLAEIAAEAQLAQADAWLPIAKPAPAAAASWAPTTKTGSLAPALPDADLTRAVQRELQVLGYDSGSVDGVAGLTTRAAIMAFEWDHGLALSGEPKQDVLQSLLAGGSQGSGVAGAGALQPIGAGAKDVIKIVQQHLKFLGLSKLKPSGSLDEGTRGAIRRFEAREGLQQTGRISGRMVGRLIKLVADKGTSKSTKRIEKPVAKS